MMPLCITATRLASRETTAKSWLTISIAVLSPRRDSSKVSTCACTVVSRAVVGSSAISKRGLQAMAEAISARWRKPPDN